LLLGSMGWRLLVPRGVEGGRQPCGESAWAKCPCRLWQWLRWLGGSGMKMFCVVGLDGGVGCLEERRKGGRSTALYGGLGGRQAAFAACKAGCPVRASPSTGAGW